MGHYGKSAARSYMTALDRLIQVDASIFGSIVLNLDQNLKSRFEIVHKRYANALGFLRSPDEHNTSKTKLTAYVEKQGKCKDGVEQYTSAQQRVLEDYRAAIQARDMDLVAHGYKFEREFNFGIVDTPSGLRRFESSEEAYENVTLIAADGASEYAGLDLSPAEWAHKVQTASNKWGNKKSDPFPLERRPQTSHLKRPLVLHQALRGTIQSGQCLPSINGGEDVRADDELSEAYSSTHQTFNNDNKARSQIRSDIKQSVTRTVNEKIDLVKTKIDNLAKAHDRPVGNKAGKVTVPEAQDAVEDINETDEPGGDPEASIEATNVKPSQWTKVAYEISQSQDEVTKVIGELASGIAAKASCESRRAFSGTSHTRTSTQIRFSIANLDVEIRVDCMIVEVERPWTHAERFSHHDADVFLISPGSERLYETVSGIRAMDAEYAEFCSSRSAFVIATNVQLEFSGYTTHMENVFSSSSTEANVPVGYGPFSLSASHEQSKSKSKTRYGSTAAGMRISLQTLQLIA